MTGVWVDHSTFRECRNAEGTVAFDRPLASQESLPEQPPSEVRRDSSGNRLAPFPVVPSPWGYGMFRCQGVYAQCDAVGDPRPWCCGIDMAGMMTQNGL